MEQVSENGVGGAKQAMVRTVRRPDEMLLDDLLTLSLLAEAERQGLPWVERPRLQQLIFIIERDWFERGWKGFNFTFARYPTGPFTEALALSIENLRLDGFLELVTPVAYRPTDLGRQLARELWREWRTDANRPFAEDIVATVQRFGHLMATKAHSFIQQLPVMPVGSSEPTALAGVDIGAVLLYPLELEPSAKALALPWYWRERGRFGRFAALQPERTDTDDPVYNPDQAWFWTEEWQRGEREVDEEIARGEVMTFDDVESFIAHLEAQR